MPSASSVAVDDDALHSSSSPCTALTGSVVPTRTHSIDARLLPRLAGAGGVGRVCDGPIMPAAPAVEDDVGVAMSCAVVDDDEAGPELVRPMNIATKTVSPSTKGKSVFSDS